MLNLNEPLLLKPGVLASLMMMPIPSPGGHVNGPRYEDREIQVKNGVAIIDVDGVLMERCEWFDAWYNGALSMHAFRTKVEQLKSNKDVKHAVFCFSSPGGDVNGTQNAAKAIYGLREAGIRTTAYINSCACSGAQWIAASCEEIILSSETCECGSIGVVVAHKEVSELEKKIGIKTTEITSGEKKREWSAYEPLTEDGKKALSDRARAFHEIFLSEMMRYRPNLTKANVKEWGDGKIFIGSQAIDVGLADKIEYIPDLFLIGERNVDLEKLQKEFPQVYAAALQLGKDQSKADMSKAIETAKAEGIASERQRVTAIMEVKWEGYESAKANAIKTGTSINDFAISLVQGQVQKDQVPQAQQPTPQGQPKVDVKDIARGFLYLESPTAKQQLDTSKLSDAEMEAAINAAVASANKA